MGPITWLSQKRRSFPLLIGIGCLQVSINNQKTHLFRLISESFSINIRKMTHFSIDNRNNAVARTGSLKFMSRKTKMHQPLPPSNKWLVPCPVALGSTWIPIHLVNSRHILFINLFFVHVWIYRQSTSLTPW